jgi:hypothetical protein
VGICRNVDDLRVTGIGTAWPGSSVGCVDGVEGTELGPGSAVLFPLMDSFCASLDIMSGAEEERWKGMVLLVEDGTGDVDFDEGGELSLDAGVCNPLGGIG